MKKIVWVYGLIAGVIMGGMLFISVPLHQNGTLDMGSGMLVGYTTMVIALSLVFFGVKSYRDNHKSGNITFGNAFKVGILITVVASLLYSLSWEIAYHTVSKGFAEDMTRSYVAKKKSEAKNEAEVQAIIAEAEKNQVMYENVLFRFPMTLMEVFPVGLIVTLITAALLRRKEFLPPTQEVAA